jgi:hypothetical protein
VKNKTIIRKLETGPSGKLRFVPDEITRAEAEAEDFMRMRKTASLGDLHDAGYLRDVVVASLCEDERAQKLLAKYKSDRARNAANIQHEGVGERNAALRADFASGNFLTRDICADEQWEHRGFNSRRTAQKALIGTPDPNPWPAKEKEKARKAQAKREAKTKVAKKKPHLRVVSAR